MSGWYHRDTAGGAQHQTYSVESMKRMTLRVSPQDDAVFTRAGKASGLSKNAYAQRAILEAARRRGPAPRSVKDRRSVYDVEPRPESDIL